MKLEANPILSGARRVVAAFILGLLLSACDDAIDTDTAGTGAADESSPANDSSIPPDAVARQSSSEAPAPNDLAAALQIPDSLVRIERVSRLLQAAEPERLEEIKQTFGFAALDRGDLEYVLFIEWWADFDPRRAFRFAISPDIRAEHGRIAAAAARAWTRKDAQAAIESEYFRHPQSPDKSYSTELLDGAVVGWFESGQPGLEEFLSGLSTRSDITRGMRTYARMRVLRDGARETLEWTREPSPFPADHQRLLLAGALTIIAHEDPKLAAEWLPVAESDGVDTRTFKMRIAGGWAHHDPLAAFEWISTLPDDAERSSAFGRAATRWYEADPRAFKVWLSQQAGDGKLDRSRSYVVRTDILRDPRGVDWPDTLRRAQQSVDETQRANLVTWTLQHWKFLDSKAANEWIDAHRDTLSEDQIERAGTISEFDQRRLERTIEEKEKYAR